MRIPPLKIKVLLESSPLKSRISVRILAAAVSNILHSWFYLSPGIFLQYGRPFFDFPQTSSIFFDFRALVRCFLIFCGEKQGKNKTGNFSIAKSLANKSPVTIPGEKLMHKSMHSNLGLFRIDLRIYMFSACRAEPPLAIMI